MERSTRLAAALLLTSVFSLLQAQGPQVGEKLALFRLPDQNGTLQTFESIRGPKGAMVVFHRSADWCAYCKTQLAEIEQSRADLRARGLGVAAISYDSVPILKHFADRKGIGFPLLSDGDSAFIKTLNLLDEEVPKASEFYGIPRPITLLLDARGVVVSRVFDEDFRRRTTIGSILGRRTGAAPVEAKRVRVTRSSSDSVVHGGQRFRIQLEIDIPQRSHVYAPAVQGYIPIEWKIDASAGYTAEPVKYPASRQMHLPAIGETVPIYDGKLLLEREIVPAEKLPAGDFRIQGSLRCQVCDDRQCYVPETIPLEWTLKYEPHDNVRAPVDLRRQRRQ